MCVLHRVKKQNYCTLEEERNETIGPSKDEIIVNRLDYIQMYAILNDYLMESKCFSNWPSCTHNYILGVN